MVCPLLFTSPVLNALGVTTVYDPAKIGNIKAEAGISPIAGLGYQVAPPIYIEIEDQTAADISNPLASLNHNIVGLAAPTNDEAWEAAA